MRTQLRREMIFVLGLSLFMLAVNGAPWVLRLFTTPAGRAFVPFYNSDADYASYTAYIKQGIDGALLVHNPFTPVAHAGGVIFIIYLFLGHIGRIAGVLDAHLIYHISRYVLGFIWFLVLWGFFRRIFSRQVERLTAFLFAVTSASFPYWTLVNGKPQLTWHMSWWTEFDPIKRAAFLPHYLVGHILLVVLLQLFFSLVDRARKELLILVGVLAFVTGVIHTPSLIILLLILPAWAVLSGNWRSLRYWLFLCITGGAGLLLVNWQSQQFPWYYGRWYEGLSFAVSIWECVLALGPIVILAPIGFVLAKKDRWTLVSVLWVVGSLAMIWISEWMLTLPEQFRVVPLSNIRFLQTALWVPLALLSAKAMGVVAAKWGKPAVIAVLAVYAGLTFLAYPQSVVNQYQLLMAADEYHAPKTQWYRAIQDIAADHLAGPVFALSWTGSLIPSYTGRTVFVGQKIVSPSYDEQMQKAYTFYQGLPICAAYHVVHDAGVRTVFFGFDEHIPGTAVTTYPFLTLWKTFGETSLYTVNEAPPQGC